MTLHRWRLLSLALFSLLCLVIGFEFHLWLRAVEAGLPSPVARPPGVEAFLPLSSLLNLVHLFHTGSVHPYHPGGLVIFVAILVSCLVLGKSFCSWVCPVGFASELLWSLRQRLRPGDSWYPHRWLDVLMRSLKYLLLGAFLWAICVSMDAVSIRAFLDSPYNLVADAKMYDFFARLSLTGGGVIAALAVGSLFIRNFWCRYLCPYGALLGLVGLLSLHRIVRNPDKCISCEKCTRACPNALRVHDCAAVRSAECSSCLECLGACPVPGALATKNRLFKATVPWRWLPAYAMGVLLAIITSAMVAGFWKNGISDADYREPLRMRNSFQHPGR